MVIASRRCTWMLLVSILVLLSSCTAHKKIPYLKDVETITAAQLDSAAQSYEAKIMPKDILSITVNTPTQSASKDFNLPLIPQEANDVIQTRVSSSSGGYGSLQNYIVDNDGYIDFPVVGKVKIGGLAKSEAQKAIYDLLYPKYLKEEPIVSIRYLNYKVSILGEVAKPGIYTSPNEQMTLFDALAFAGDLTIYGKRNDIRIIRQHANGEKQIFTIDLQDKNVLLNNETYYLQQNDVVYVSPNKAKGNNSSFGTLESLALSGLSLLISIISIITR